MLLASPIAALQSAFNKCHLPQRCSTLAKLAMICVKTAWVKLAIGGPLLDESLMQVIEQIVNKPWLKRGLYVSNIHDFGVAKELWREVGKRRVIWHDDQEIQAGNSARCAEILADEVFRDFSHSDVLRFRQAFN